MYTLKNLLRASSLVSEFEEGLVQVPPASACCDPSSPHNRTWGSGVAIARLGVRLGRKYFRCPSGKCPTESYWHPPPFLFF